MEPKERIQQKAHDLFMLYGIRSVTMDEIALQSGVSKKTIYQFFSDKDELVEAVMEYKIQYNQALCEEGRIKCKDPIHEMFISMQMMQEMFENMNPSIMSDLEKFHPKAFEKFKKHKYTFIYHVLKSNLEKGVELGLYRDDFDVDTMIKLRLETMMLPFNLMVFPKSKYRLGELAALLTEHYLFGLATSKGHKLIVKYQQDRLKK